MTPYGANKTYNRTIFNIDFQKFVLVLPPVSLLYGRGRSVITSLYGHSCYFLPPLSVAGLFPPLFFFLCISQFSLLQTIHLSCGFPCFLQPQRFFVSAHFWQSFVFYFDHMTVSSHFKGGGCRSNFRGNFF